LKCRSAANRDPAEVGSFTLMLLRKSAQGWGPDRCRSGPPSSHLFCGQFQYLNLNSGWGPASVLKHTNRRAEAAPAWDESAIYTLERFDAALNVKRRRAFFSHAR
jgi:hypothetical protein